MVSKSRFSQLGALYGLKLIPFNQKAQKGASLWITGLTYIDLLINPIIKEKEIPMNTTTPKLLLLCVGIILSSNAVAASKSKKPATAKQLEAETAARISSDRALRAAISGLALGGIQSPAGTPGPQGPAGIPGVQGPTGIVSTNSFAGGIPNIPYGETDFSMRGPSSTVTITATQRLTATVTAALGTTAGTADFDYNLCYQNVQTGVITEFSPGAYISVTAGATIATFTASQSVVPGVAGDYKVGMCIQNSSLTTALDKNDWGQGWVMVTH